MHSELCVCRSGGTHDQHQFPQVEVIGVEARATIHQAVESERRPVGIGVLLERDFDADVIASSPVIGLRGQAAEHCKDDCADAGAPFQDVSHVRVLHLSHSP
ncbi:MAG: hypothetical protein F4Y86_11890 [Gammaproteobacteria bacterium]|nr:hypothetical protein [Gammaproteobacteria bacterium]